MDTNAKDTQTLKNIFISLLARYTNDSGKVEALWEALQKAYSGKKRHYHNLDHLQYMLMQLETCRHLITDWDTVLFSLFYHDFIYSATAKDNEEKSADIAVTVLESIDYPKERIEKCRTQILATKSHTAGPDDDTNLLTDADLSILGSPWEDYLAYAKKVRKEYAIYPDFLYNPRRRKVLGHFLAMEHIFKTPLFREQFEENAKKNLTTELVLLP